MLPKTKINFFKLIFWVFILKYLLPTNNYLKTAVFSSPYVRCIQTVENFIGRNFVYIDPNLREFNEEFNTSLEDIYNEIETYNKEGVIEISNQFNTPARLYDGSVVETNGEMKERCKEFKNKIENILLKASYKNIVICTHGSIAEELIYLFTGEKLPMLEMGTFLNIPYKYVLNVKILLL